MITVNEYCSKKFADLSPIKLFYNLDDRGQIATGAMILIGLLYDARDPASTIGLIMNPIDLINNLLGTDMHKLNIRIFDHSKSTDYIKAIFHDTNIIAALQK